MRILIAEDDENLREGESFVNNYLTLDRLCRRLAKLLHTTIRIYGVNKERIAEYGKQEEQPDILVVDQAFEEMLLQKAKVSEIYVHIEMDSVLYAASLDKETGNRIVMGPYCFDGEPAYVSERIKSIHGVDKSIVYRMVKGQKEVFDEGVLMLYDMLSRETLDAEQMYVQYSNISSASTDMEHNAVKISYTYREEEQLHNSYDQELREQEAIRTGDVFLLKESRANGYKGKFGTLAQDPLRSRKNLGVVAVAISVRSAIEGGVGVERALTFSDAAIQKLERAKSIPEVDTVTVEAQMYLTRMVHEVKNANKPSSNSPLVEEAKLIIARNLHNKISTSFLAKELKISQSGLYKAFLREENMTVSDYILKKKIEASKELLMYSEDTYGEIAACYSFSSQSHFGQTFKRFAGMTPGAYRKKYGIQRK
ncbi:helix-turn-helix domain-containing protein [Faecalimonas sp. LCP19S3_D12]